MKVKFTDLYKLIPEKKKVLSKLNYLIKNSKFVGGMRLKILKRILLNIPGQNIALLLAMVQMHLRLQ